LEETDGAFAERLENPKRNVNYSEGAVKIF